MAKNPAQVALTKQNLKNAFWSLYKTKRINKISIKEITDLSGYNRGTFYLYYQDVYHMLNEIEEEILNELSEISYMMISLVVNTKDNTDEFNIIFNFFKNNMEHISVLLGENGDAYFQSKFKNLLKNSIKNHLRVDAIDFSDDTIDFTLEFFISGMIGLILHYFSKNREPNADALKKISNTILVQSGIKDLLK